MPRAALPACLLLLCVPLAGRAGEPFPVAGEWPCERGRQSLLARSPLKGHLTTPRLAWKYDTGSLRTSFVVEPAAGAGSLRLPDPNAPLAALDRGDPRWGLLPPEAEVGGGRQPLWRTERVTYADVRPDLPGLEKIEFESGFDLPTVSGRWQPCAGHCYGWQKGAWVQLWQTAPIEMLFSALPLSGDFDGDGALEIALLPWYELLLLDARTGAVKYRCRFTGQRSYGFFGACDLDGDGRSEFLVQADFCKHVDVLAFREGRLALLWQREIEAEISNPRKVLRAYPHPVADVDGDGRPELVLSIYSETGDQRWHVTVREPLTGGLRADLPGECLAGLFDLDGDGLTELLTSVTAGAGPPPGGTIRVRSLRGGQPTTLWAADGAAWVTWEPPLPANVNSAATGARRDLLCREAPGGAWVAVRRPRPHGSDELLVGQWHSGRLHFTSRVSGAGLAAVALSPRGALLAAATTAPGQQAQLAVSGGRARAVCAEYPGGATATPAVVCPDGETRPTIVVPGLDEQLVAFYPPQDDRPARERWRLSGRAPGENWPETRGAVLADLLGDGRRQVLYATAAPGGGARLVAAALDGRELWHHDFPAIPGTPPVWNTGGVILWQTGHLTDRRSLDVVVTVRRSMMHSEETYALSGRDGHELWHRDRLVSDRGVGGTPFALADYDGDGRDDLATFHPSLVCLLQGSSGADLLARDAAWDSVPARPVYWGLPLAGDFEGTGRPSLFFATTRRSLTALVRTDGSLAWSDALDRSPCSLPAVGDFDGDGRLEAVAVGYGDGTRCYEGASGKVEWVVPTPVAGTPRGAASADLDSDGRDEAIFTTGTTLWCLGAPGRLLWQFPLPAAGSPPAVADLDGRLSILILCANHEVCCLQ